jgi:multidrug efflux pump subunit AcrA (membrane-fusion protein)
MLPAQKAMMESLPPQTSIVVQTPVRLGTLDRNRFPVISGLAAGDQVVVSNTALLRTFMPVKVAAATSTGASN